jgi:serine/threonine-protein kinase
MSETKDVQATIAERAEEPATPEAQLHGRFGRYDVERLLGRGGMGAVYLARQLDLDRPVVIKVIAPELAKDAAIVGRLQREARSAARISSDNVVQVHETGTEQGVPYIAMEYVDGSSAHALVQERGPLAWQEATRIITAAARGLQAAHEVSVLHRDVKPANILVSKDGRVKVADFGLAKVEMAPGSSPGLAGQETRATLSSAGQILGTPAYMPPEQAEGQTVDARSDIYALGVSFYELLTGALPFRAETALKTLALVISATPAPPRQVVPSIPDDVEMTCLKLMARDPARRPKTAAEAVQLLERLTASSPSGRVPPRTPSNPRVVVSGPTVVPGPERSSILPGVIAAAVILAVPAFLFIALRTRPPLQPPAAPKETAATTPLAAPPAPAAEPEAAAIEDVPVPALPSTPPSHETGAPRDLKVQTIPVFDPSKDPLPPSTPDPTAPAAPPKHSSSPDREAQANARYIEVTNMPKGARKPEAWKKLVEDFPGTKAAATVYKMLQGFPEPWKQRNADWLKQHDGGK